MQPVGSPIAGARELFGVNEGLKKIHGMTVDLLPVRADSPRHFGDEMGGEIWHRDPRQDEESAIVGQKVQVGSALGGGPSNEPVSASDMPGNRRPAETGYGSLGSHNQVLEMLPDRLAVTQVVVVFHKTVKKALQGSPSYLVKLDLGQSGYGAFYRGLIDGGWRGLFSDNQWIVGAALFGRQRDMTRSVQFKHQRATDHITKCPVWLHPVPCQAQLAGKAAAAVRGMFGYKGADEGDILRGNSFASVC